MSAQELETLEMGTSVVGIASAPMLIGAGVALILWQVLRAVTVVPGDARQYRDLPPLAFRAVWLPIRLLVFNFSAFMPKQRLDILDLKLGRAGVQYSLDADEVFAAKIVSSIVLACLSSILVAVYGKAMLVFVFAAAFLGFHYPDSWLGQKAMARQADMIRTLPFYLDVITLSVEAGSNLTGGITQAVQKTDDSALRRELSRVLRDIRSGRTRADALRDFASRADCTPVTQVVSGLIQGEKAGASLGPLLRAQAEQLRSQRFQMAEKKAMQAPVKLLAPLFICIFPMTFVALAFVMLSKTIQGGMISSPMVLWAYTWPGV